MSNYYEKYLKYKNKYLQLKKQHGGFKEGNLVFIKTNPTKTGTILAINENNALINFNGNSNVVKLSSLNLLTKENTRASSEETISFVNQYSTSGVKLDVPDSVPLNANIKYNQFLNNILKRPIEDFKKVNVSGDGSCFYHAVMRYLTETNQLESVKNKLIIDGKYNAFKISNKDRYWGVILRYTCVKRTEELILRLKELKEELVRTNYKNNGIIHQFMGLFSEYGVTGYTIQGYYNATSGLSNSNIIKFFDEKIRDIEKDYLEQFSNFNLNKSSEWIDGYLMEFVAKTLNKCIMVYNNISGWETPGKTHFSLLTPNECIFVGLFGYHYNALIPINNELPNESSNVTSNSLFLDEMPQLCFGTVQHSDLTKTLAIALESGIYHIDGADNYGGEKYRTIIKECIKDVQRNKLWITWKSDTITIENIESVIKDLDCHYIDTFLIHRSCGVEKDYRVLKEAQSKGLIRFFGNSNCEDFKILSKLKTDYDISTIQIQARPPGGKISGRKNLDPDFIERCNLIGINVMIFSTISGIFGSKNPGNTFEMINLLNKKTTLINKYYIQKYCLSAKNVIMISSESGKSIPENKKDFDNIMDRKKLLSEKEIVNIEDKLKRVVLSRQ